MRPNVYRINNTFFVILNWCKNQHTRERILVKNIYKHWQNSESSNIKIFSTNFWTNYSWQCVPVWIKRVYWRWEKNWKKSRIAWIFSLFYLFFVSVLFRTKHKIALSGYSILLAIKNTECKTLLFCVAFSRFSSIRNNINEFKSLLF